MDQFTSEKNKTSTKIKPTADIALSCLQQRENNEQETELEKERQETEMMGANIWDLK